MNPIEEAKALAAEWRRVAEWPRGNWLADKARETADLLEKLIRELQRP